YGREALLPVWVLTRSRASKRAFPSRAWERGIPSLRQLIFLLWIDEFRHVASFFFLELFDERCYHQTHRRRLRSAARPGFDRRGTKAMWTAQLKGALALLLAISVLAAKVPGEEPGPSVVH